MNMTRTQAQLNDVRARTIRQCKEAHITQPLCGATALKIYGSEFPFTDEPDTFHVMVRDASHRRRAPHVKAHTWKQLEPTDILYTEGLQVLSPEATAVTLAGTLNIMQQVMLLEAMVRNQLFTFPMFADYTHKRTFHGKKRALAALKLYQDGSASMTETALRLELNRRGVPRLVLNYVVPNVWYPNGAPITFDLALPEMKIAWEYQGDHHRTDKAQYRRDAYKGNLARSKNWTLFDVTYDDLHNQQRLNELALQAAVIIAQRTGTIPRMDILTLQQLADRRRVFWKRSSSGT